MAGFTKPITTGVTTFQNLLALMKANGYKGDGNVSKLSIFNADAAQLLYIHLTDNGVTAP